MKRLLKRVVRSLGYEIRAIQDPPLEPFVGEPAALDYELLRAFATRAARISVSAAETRAARHLYLTGILGAARTSRLPRLAIGGPHTSKIGIWSRESADKESAFVRRAGGRGEWFYWAA